MANVEELKKFTNDQLLAELSRRLTAAKAPVLRPGQRIAMEEYNEEADNYGMEYVETEERWAEVGDDLLAELADKKKRDEEYRSEDDLW